MRKTLVRTLLELAASDERIVLLTGDLGYTVLEPFAQRFPARFFNVGVAEQNMVGMATGMAEAGFIPYVYSIATFASLRPFEFIRNGPILHQFPVRIAGIGGGFEYGPAGVTHHGLEDVGVMRTQPGITVIAPADHQQARAALRSTWNLPGPIYYRFGKNDQDVITGLEGRFELGRAQVIGDGGDLLWLVMGPVAREVVAAAEQLGSDGVRCTVAVVASLNPAPVEDLSRLLGRFRHALTVEAHYRVGGIGSLTAEIIAEQGIPCRLVRCAVDSATDGISGNEEFMNRKHGLSREQLVATAVRALKQ